jgi:hypothetical protein
LTAAVLATAAVAITSTGTAVSAAVDSAVRAEVAVAGKGHPLDVRRMLIVESLRPGASYRLPAFRIRNHRGIRTAYRLVVLADAPRPWLRFVPAAVVLDAGQSRPVGVRLRLPHDAAPGVYAVVLGVRPGGSEGVRLTFRIEPADSTWVRQAAKLARWAVPASIGAVLVVFLVRVGASNTGSKKAADV